MAREFKVQATIVAEDQASATLRALKAEFAEVGGRIDKLAASEKSLATASQQATTATKQLATETKTVAAASQQASTGIDGTVKKLLGFGSAVAVLATVRRGIQAIAENMTVSEAAATRFDDASQKLKTSLADLVVDGESGLNALAAAMDSIADSANRASTATSSWWDSIKQQFPAIAEGLDAMKGLFGANEAAVDAFVAKTAKLSEFWNRGAVEIDTYDRALAGLEAVLKTTGVSFDESALAAARQRDSLEQLNAAYDAGLITSEKYQEILKALENSTRTTTEAQVDAAASSRELATSTASIAEASQVAIGGLQAQAREALVTASAFDALVAAQGRAGAVSAAVSAGGSLSSAGRRVSIVGGSRLTSAPGLTGFVGRSSLGRPRIVRN